MGPMTAPGGTSTHSPGAAAVIVENIRGGLCALVRRPKPPPGFVPMWRHLKLHAVLVVCAVLLSMLFLDAPLHEVAAGLPEWVVDDAYVVTDFGRSNWILVPVGVPLVLMTLLASPAIPYMSRAVLAMVAVR